MFAKPLPYVPPEPVKVVTVEIQPEIYQPPLPKSVKLEDIRWIVITKDNLSEKVTELENITGNDFVVFAMTPHDYENLAYNLQEVRRYIRQLNEVVVYYQSVTKSKE
jgi:hypothetical protein